MFYHLVVEMLFQLGFYSTTNCAKEIFESSFYPYCTFNTCKLANIESHQFLDCATLQLFDVYFAFNEPKIACLAIINSNKKFIKNH